MQFRRPWLLSWALLVIGATLGQAEDTPAPLPANEVVKRMTLPEGFRATLFAGEPDVVQPIAVAFDDRGRLWVVECLSYPKWQTSTDRVLIFEDQDGDGRFDKRKVFWDHGSNLSGIAVGFGGVWLCSTPNLIFLPDADSDDRPDGPPQILLDGWDIRARHNVFNSLTWGLDGWLYGLNGISSKSLVGSPGTPDAQRTPINCGVWRYHPTRRIFEAFAHGTTNPWGLDFDDYGEAFITNCVIKHLWHMVPGAHTQRMNGQDLMPHAYELMPSCADHIHWAGGDWKEARGGEKHDAAGGGHAHCGAMIYLGDNWPASYRNHIFMCNIHGNRLNQDLLERQGSGYVAHHGEDFMQVDDPWFRGVVVTNGPDGVYVTDWTDTGECHNYETVNLTNGRIFKITYGQPKPWKGDLGKLSDEQLVELQLHPNEWLVRQARRLLQERHTAQSDGKPRPLSEAARQRLKDILDNHADVTRRLRALWSLHVTGELDAQALTALLASSNEHLRGWAVRLLLEKGPTPTEATRRLAELAAHDPSPLVRLALASGLQRLPVGDRWEIATGLLSHSEDVSDANLPLMIWYGVEPLVPADPERAARLALDAKIPLVTTFIARRLVSVKSTHPPDSLDPASPSGLDTLVATLGSCQDAKTIGLLVTGMEMALKGQRQVPMPAAWTKIYARLISQADQPLRRSLVGLTLIFGDGKALAELQALAANRAADREERCWAIESLVQVRDRGIVAPLQSLVAEPALALVALRSLAVFDDADTPRIVLDTYAKLAPDAQADAVSVLCSRPAWALALLGAIEKGQISKTALSTDQVRQLGELRDKQVTAEVSRVWGSVRQSPQDKRALMEKYRERLSTSKETADRTSGRLVFARVCANCHTLFGSGGKIGPDLTGSQRNNLDYLLTNIVDPTAVIDNDYRLVIIQTDSGRVLSGLVKQEDEKTLSLQTSTELVTLSKDEIENRRQTQVSMMPEGLIDTLSEQEQRDLVAYLAGPDQVPLPSRQ